MQQNAMYAEILGPEVEVYSQLTEEAEFPMPNRRIGQLMANI